MQSRTKLPKGLFESICAILNRDGGNILLGVDDDGAITGDDRSRIDGIEPINLRTAVYETCEFSAISFEIRSRE